MQNNQLGQATLYYIIYYICQFNLQHLPRVQSSVFPLRLAKLQVFFLPFLPVSPSPFRTSLFWCGRGWRRTLFAALTCFLHFIDLSSCLQVHLDNQLIDCRTVESSKTWKRGWGKQLGLTEVSNLIYGIELPARSLSLSYIFEMPYIVCLLYLSLFLSRHHLVMSPNKWFHEAPQRGGRLP